MRHFAFTVKSVSFKSFDLQMPQGMRNCSISVTAGHSWSTLFSSRTLPPTSPGRGLNPYPGVPPTTPRSTTPRSTTYHTQEYHLPHPGGTTYHRTVGCVKSMDSLAPFMLGEAMIIYNRPPSSWPRLPFYDMQGEGGRLLPRSSTGVPFYLDQSRSRV